MSKKTIRQHILKEMKHLSSEQKKLADQWLFNELIEHELYQKATKIGIVLSMPHEVNTDPMIQHMLEDDKQVFVPSMNYKNKTMDFQQLTDLSIVDYDEKGIRYITEDTQIYNNLDLVIVPGVAFNEEGYRIGYGGGYFDRYLNTYDVQNISLIYDIQLCDNIPIESHDFRVEHLIIAKT
ncbi:MULTISPECIES: 5-formyltetrahydrofolate cyclo-ligase [unclassified Staphylococcus]|uniref:5-formyltetrahydrofolate cyclo-ligase n=1 Tax=unclassified Staphylococcus TaxID=91994 RepID=UPI0021D1C405|nr:MULTISPECIES: 5-formyltetrahydrofolate cyclo-ligase [unclassified Staphylococcus]UXR68668.1 5-formyltetrahydrofolate cyclo-ligase [Staphylococcus sp. IVB6246]UXR72956.1 5-formyltetrahydrofolate cyclo-ligase [Staphylococcus sp. IVB6238]UXR75252.1 5-formyltetrahydrofolate cyclo-ligase [Staphylococcus sp. IVB6233]UXR79452.1 5-formyltetrahydrofolate cyclo-ligase [Staphylococcus sp. IVB6218]